MGLKSIIKKVLGRGPSDWEIRSDRDNDRVLRLLPGMLKRDSNCIDIGCHDGMFLDFFLQYAPQGKHFAFEPLPDYFERLKAKYPQVNVLNLALSDTAGEAAFFRPEGLEGMSGLKKQHYPASTKLQEIKVVVDRLDDVVPADLPYSFFKLDVEGAELGVLKGAIQTITRCQPTIMFEFARIHVEEYRIGPADVYDFFAKLGYQIHRLDMGLQYTAESFQKMFQASHESNYDRHSETNFFAVPSKR